MSEVAEALGVTRDTIRTRCAANPALAPKEVGSFAGRPVWLFTPEETEALRLDLRRRPAAPGRPQIWTPDEAADRQRRRVRQNYWNRVAELAHYQGMTDRAARAQARAAEFAHGLRVQRPGAPPPD